MANFAADFVLFFDATDSGTALTPTSTMSNTMNTETVFDFNSDGDIDSVDYYFDSDSPYSGYTILLNGNRYAIFEDAFTNTYYIPYSSSFDDLSGFAGDSISSYPVTQTGDNANVANCYLTGTLIDTPDGPRPIETLGRGSRVLTPAGPRPVLWLARQAVAATAINLDLPEGRLPVCIHAGALGEGLPRRDLWVSADHGLILDGYIVNAGALVNGTTIRFAKTAEMPARFTYWHIELEHHAMIRAEGAASESFVDYVGRDSFDNHDQYRAECGADRVIAEMDMPRIGARRLLPAALKRRLWGQYPVQLSA